MTAPMQLELCPWPGCEGNADIKSDAPPFYVQCRTCDCQGPHCETEDEAVVAWASLPRRPANALEAAKRILASLPNPWRPVLLDSERGELRERLSPNFAPIILDVADSMEKLRRDADIVARALLSLVSERDAVIEECARVADKAAADCDQLARYYANANNGSRENAENSARVHRVIASLIRALKTE